ncbi:hypothetical protein [Nannocystis pusilla]|uniref:Lipoprotein n=1 Tax=Nannocystis pusilla TaxID=889268 RepID=A0ABS7TW73_9BACT|nr:hypothetical protein [Nannocystis pusilla]MBZ5712515.1 hypothetical protein [Nannocystis pusilla]
MRRLAVLLVLAACPSPSLPAVTDSAGGGQPPTSAASTTGTTGCMRSGDCDTDAICVAAYGPTTGELGGERGPAECVEDSACIGALDLGRWCFDHQSCCGDLRCRTADGVCEPPDLGVSTGATSTDGDGDTTTTSSTSTSTSTDSDDGTTTTTGTSTTTTTGTSTSG